MDFGYTKIQILSMLDQHLSTLAVDLEAQVNKIKENGENSEISLATLISTSMLSILESVSAVIEVNNKKLLQDLISNG
ncbi:MAG: hypothetical protein H7263_01045, partial [Candidatus Sericytochromatia bacterium]|nr:hypothetical protein [Candidatus Sericytochromatia bacterium]